MYSFVFEKGIVLVIKASNRKEAIDIIHRNWYKDICYKENYTAHRVTGSNVG